MVRRTRAPRPRADAVSGPSQEQPDTTAEEQTWLRADYVCHVFHYRMPETVAIASVNPVVPSPLTIKLALMAALLRDGRVEDAERLAPRLPEMEVLISPPDSSVIFRALLRYVRPPAERGSQRIDANTGGTYGTNPHSREFALWGSRAESPHRQGPAGALRVFLRVPQSLASVVESALYHIGYLGATDSLVTCIGVQVEPREPARNTCCAPVREDGIPPVGFGNFVVRLADLAPGVSVELLQLVPSQRVRSHYIPNPENPGLFVLPGEMVSYGRVKFYQKRSSQ